MKVWWIEQKYVIPVVANTLEEAENIAFKDRCLIARECGGNEKQYHPPRLGLFDGAKDDWDNCVPYGESDGKTLIELEEAGVK
jgi:hypothetical protein